MVPQLTTSTKSIWKVRKKFKPFLGSQSLANQCLPGLTLYQFFHWLAVQEKLRSIIPSIIFCHILSCFNPSICVHSYPNSVPSMIVLLLNSKLFAFHMILCRKSRFVVVFAGISHVNKHTLWITTNTLLSFLFLKERQWACTCECLAGQAYWPTQKKAFLRALFKKHRKLYTKVWNTVVLTQVHHLFLVVFENPFSWWYTYVFATIGMICIAYI